MDSCDIDRGALTLGATLVGVVGVPIEATALGLAVAGCAATVVSDEAAASVGPGVAVDAPFVAVAPTGPILAVNGGAAVGVPLRAAGCEGMLVLGSRRRAE